MAIGLALRRLLDPQSLDGGGLLAYEEAQPLEAGLMIVRWMDDASRIARDTQLSIYLSIGLMNTRHLPI